ncbi:MAG TPA: Gfo/Idh/MocA family oxidoreductase, partial [Armatimonadota bacterium]|nr:Gfo/Idh/MocA family oxidoreductase [Armatimonadota bacterium]
LCDVDERAIETATAALTKAGAKPPKAVRDFRKILDDPAVDALVIAAPDHWHAPATILACDAGKHVYVEKPASHNPREGELMIAAARKHRRVVQLGTQRRSMPGVIEAVTKVRSGDIGQVLLARGWYNNSRPTIGHGKTAPVPGWLDYDLWQGPAPERPFRDNVVHYNWHWFWHWGTGELGNNGIHSLDVCRWGLGVDYPLRVTAGGGKYRYEDDQETPDTHMVTYDFGGKSITWEGRSWHRRGFEDSMFGIAFYGDNGTVVIDGGGYRVLDPQGKEIGKGSGDASDAPHLRNFLQCVRTGDRPNADIEEGHRSTLLCHLGNIAYRTGHTLNVDPKTGRVVGDREAMALWSREYRKGWAPKV